MAANVTDLVLKNYWRPIECVFMLIVSQQCDWMGSHEAAEAIYPVTFDLYLISLLVCLLQLQLSILRLSTPPLNTHRQSAHTRCLHANTKTCMDVLRPNTYSQTDTSCSWGRTALQTLWLSALDSRLWSVYFVLHSCQLGYIRLISVCTCLKQFEGIHV